MQKKKWTGRTAAKKKRKKPNLVGDSYQADKKDLQAIRRIARKKRISKAEIIRYGVKLALMAFNASENGSDALRIPLRGADA